MEQVYKTIFEKVSRGEMNKGVASDILHILKQQQETRPEQDIAVIGLSAKLPNSCDLHEFWNYIRTGADFVRVFPQQREQDMLRYMQYIGDNEEVRFTDASYLEDLDQFDPKFFKLSPSEASLMDPAQRLFLETAWNALEDSGYVGDSVYGSSTGVYLGFARSIKDHYQKLIFDIDPDLILPSWIGNVNAMTPTRISYLLNLKGPTMIVDTACSSSLVALHLACQGLRSGDCKMAIAGGIRINLLPLDRSYYKGGIESSDNMTRPFDQHADGSGMSEGVVAVVLKSLSEALRDRDQIYGVIKGSAINQDGTSVGISAPNPEAQAACIIKAWEQAGLDPETLDYIEVHGTGTKLGDPLEVDGLRTAFRKHTAKMQICPVGTVKSNIGHAAECSGLVGFIKALLVLMKKEIPPTLHFASPNSSIDLWDSPIYLNARLTALQGKERRLCSAVSSFGFSGTNCHVILEEAPSSAGRQQAEGIYLFTVNAKTRTALRQYIDNYIDFLRTNETCSLADICYTAAVGKGHFNMRLALIARDKEDLLNQLCSVSTEPLDEPSEASWYWFRNHKVVTDLKKTEFKIVGEITLQEKQALNAEAANYFNWTLTSDRRDETHLRELALFYVAGADIDWNRWYEAVDVKKISLPTYPFEKQRCWLDIPLPPNPTARTAPAATPSENIPFYKIKWVETVAPELPISAQGNQVLLIGNPGEYYRTFKQKLEIEGSFVIEICFGPSFRGSIEDFDKLFQSVNLDSIQQIIHIGAIPDFMEEVTGLEALRHRMDKGVMSVLHLYRSAIKAFGERQVHLVLITRFSQEVSDADPFICAEAAPLFALGRVMDKENASIRCKCIDLDDKTSIESVLQEMRDDNCKLSAYRQDKKYVPQFEEEEMNQAEPSTGIRDNGVYVITGANGGLGLQVARWIARQKKVNLVFIQRTALPEKKNWESVQVDAKTLETISCIRELEHWGANVTCIAEDITNERQMESVIGHIQGRYGTIHGIVHCAGQRGDGLLEEKETEAFKQVLSAKVEGTWLLDKLTSRIPLDFFVVFSSVASWFPSVTQGDYAAANAYLDAIAAASRRKGRNITSINWSTWKEHGASVSVGFTFDTIFKSLSTREATAAFSKAIHAKSPQVFVGEINWEGPTRILLAREPLRLAANINRKLEQAGSKAAKKNTGIPSSSTNMKLSGKQNEHYSAHEIAIAKICHEVLAIGEVDIFDNFFELGADSIQIIKIVGRLNESYGLELKPADFFEHSNIYKLAQHVGVLLGESFPGEHIADWNKLFDKLETGEVSINEAINNLRR